MSKPKYSWWALKIGGNLVCALRFEYKYVPTVQDFEDLVWSENGKVEVIEVLVKVKN